MTSATTGVSQKSICESPKDLQARGRKFDAWAKSRRLAAGKL